MRSFTPRTVLSTLLAAALSQAVPALAADAETDALLLESAPEAASEGTGDTKLFFEGMIGNASRRFQPGSRDLGRASLDFSHTARIAPGLRAVISDRLDHVYPADVGADATVNSLREAYLSWQPEGGNTVLEFGRINLRYGPGYGYNPTDFFRDGSLRTLTSANPFAIRENRLGTVMLRGQRLWSGGSLSVAYSPKLEDRPNADGWSLDLGSTNNRDRALVALSNQFSQSISGQVLAYKEDGLSPTLGANLTALLSDAAVAHLEWSHGSEPDLLSRALALPNTATTRNRFVGGVTYTTLSKLSVTAEYQYNGFGLDRSNWAALGATPAIQLAYLREALRLQELAPRQAYLIYVTQKSLGFKDLDLTAYLRQNADDHSRLAWLELRHHWPSFDLTFQLQQNIGSPTTEFGILPDRRVVQVLGTYYF
ncbi:MAG: hypothetical protein Q7T10_18795 [Rhodoferax sp.]|uniref:hypothetical protein n=1 Tax=Rhodoferax sp. TaxID=50421 RepID=UPI002719EC26|nr:hypothetical protein [Rhodoferax sp.]MDO8450845.1 hypothetical protein [Rhodoferax sp.]